MVNSPLYCASIFFQKCKVELYYNQKQSFSNGLLGAKVTSLPTNKSFYLLHQLPNFAILDQQITGVRKDYKVDVFATRVQILDSL